MDILIKGMELPKTENDNFMVIVTPTGVIDVVENGNGFMMQKKKEAIELPEHGEAKDTDIAIRYIKSEMEDDFNETTTLDEKSYKEGMKRAIELIGYAPTVLEANNGSDN